MTYKYALFVTGKGTYVGWSNDQEKRVCLLGLLVVEGGKHMVFMCDRPCKSLLFHHMVSKVVLFPIIFFLFPACQI